MEQLPRREIVGTGAVTNRQPEGYDGGDATAEDAGQTAAEPPQRAGEDCARPWTVPSTQSIRSLCSLRQLKPLETRQRILDARLVLA